MNKIVETAESWRPRDQISESSWANEIQLGNISVYEKIGYSLNKEKKFFHVFIFFCFFDFSVSQLAKSLNFTGKILVATSHGHTAAMVSKFRYLKKKIQKKNILQATWKYFSLHFRFKSSAGNEFSMGSSIYVAL
jgi:hypothetical protein